MIDKEQNIDINSILATCKKAAEEINKIFGWNITYDKGEIVKQEDSVIDSNVQEEINESKDDENG